MDTSHFARKRTRLDTVRGWTKVGLLAAALAAAVACAPTPEEGAEAGDGSAQESASRLTPTPPAPVEPIKAEPIVEAPENALALELPEPREVEQVETRSTGSKRRARYDDDDDRPRRARRERRSEGRRADRSRVSRESSGGTVSLIQATLAEDVVDRRPKNKGRAFGADVDRVWAWVKVRNEGAPTHVTMVWKHEGREVYRSDLKVGTSRGWRTWTRKKIGKKRGAWSVEIRDARGKLLRAMDFTVRGGSAARTPAPKAEAPKSVASAARAVAPPRTLD